MRLVAVKCGAGGLQGSVAALGRSTRAPGNGASSTSNTSSFASRREFRANNITGMLPATGTIGVERGYGSSFDFEQMIQAGTTHLFL